MLYPQPEQTAMSKQSSIALGRLRNKFQRLPVSNCPHRVILLLLSYCDRDTYECWPSQATIQRESGYGRSAVNRALRTAESLELFQCETIGAREMRLRFPHVKANAKHRYTIYTLNPSASGWKKAEAINQDYAWRCEIAKCKQAASIENTPSEAV